MLTRQRTIGQAEGAEIAHTVEEALDEMARNNWWSDGDEDREIAVIGGAADLSTGPNAITRTRFELTEVHEDYP